MSVRQRCQKVFTAGYEFGKKSMRAIAASTKLSKSSVHRLIRAIQRRNQYPESSLWETEAGNLWLRLLVLAAVFVFALKSGVGCERLSEFFHLLRIERHVGVSPTALQTLRTKMEGKILEYQQLQQTELRQAESVVEICASADEKFFDQVVLVMLDLASGYIVVEELAENCQYQTWQEQAQQALAQVGMKARYFVSDRAKALVKLALQEMGCPSVSDLFHAMYEFGQSIGLDINCQLSRIHKQLNLAQANAAPPELMQQLQTQQTLLQDAQLTYRTILHQITTTLHPFAIQLVVPQTTKQVEANLQEQSQTLKTLQKTYHLRDYQGSIDKFNRQIHDLAAVVDIWWSWVKHCLDSFGCDWHTQNWVEQQLLPAVYWQQQARRTKTPTLKQAYQVAYQQAEAALMSHPFTATVPEDVLKQWQAWASWMVAKFQRTSSPVEGRNSYLSQIHHNRRGISSRRLKVLTVIHNFNLKRADGTTAAERLFGRQFPDLFQWTVEQMGELPLPRKARKRSQPKVLPLDSVPA